MKEKHPLRKIFIFIILIMGVMLIYSRYITTETIIMKEYPIINEKIPNNFHGFKIVHFSDLLYGSITNKKMLNSLNDQINLVKPDLIVFTGDLISNNKKLNTKDKETLINFINKLDSKIGIYFIKGNIDTTDDYNYILENSNITLLDNSNIKLYNEGLTPIVLIGLNKQNEYNLAYSFEDINYYKILLTHKPDNIIGIENMPDLILAGHSLNGQFRLPFIGSLYNVSGSKRYNDSYYKIDNSELFISSGIGTNYVNLRTFNNPSFNLYRLYSK